MNNMTSTPLTRAQAFEKALARMPKQFTSYMFGDMVRKSGYNLEYNGGGIIGEWLASQKTVKRISSKQWAKIDQAQTALPIQNGHVKSLSEFLKAIPEDKLIAHITSLGYIVLKP